VGGLAGGLALVYILCMVTSAVSVMAGGPASLPGIVSSRSGLENGALAVEFIPDWSGIGTIAALVALVSAVLAARRPSAASDPRAHHWIPLRRGP
jgi:hypothetical protein